MSISLTFVLSTAYVTAQQNHNLHADLLLLENNIRLVNHILRFNLKTQISGTDHVIHNSMESYFIDKTHRFNRFNEPILGLYKLTQHQHKILLVEGVDSLDVHYDFLREKLKGVSIRLKFHINKQRKLSYIYIAL